MQRQSSNSRPTMPIVAFARHRLNPSAPPATKANSPAEIRKRQQELVDATKVIDMVLRGEDIKKLDGMQLALGLGALLQARLDARKRGVK